MAQQLKNKDIPEGGSKAVLLLKPNSNKTKAVRGSINALIDLLVPRTELTSKDDKELIDFYGKEEIIFLGPDENITNDLINWMEKHAEKRSYPYAKAFISSKPDF